jgi:hypothetical protein
LPSGNAARTCFTAGVLDAEPQGIQIEVVEVFQRLLNVLWKRDPRWSPPSPSDGGRSVILAFPQIFFP